MGLTAGVIGDQGEVQASDAHGDMAIGDGSVVAPPASPIDKSNDIAPAACTTAKLAAMPCSAALAFALVTTSMAAVGILADPKERRSPFPDARA